MMGGWRWWWPFYFFFWPISSVSIFSFPFPFASFYLSSKPYTNFISSAEFILLSLDLPFFHSFLSVFFIPNSSTTLALKSHLLWWPFSLYSLSITPQFSYFYLYYLPPLLSTFISSLTSSTITQSTVILFLFVSYFSNFFPTEFILSSFDLLFLYSFSYLYLFLPSSTILALKYLSDYDFYLFFLCILFSFLLLNSTFMSLLVYFLHLLRLTTVNFFHPHFFSYFFIFFSSILFHISSLALFPSNYDFQPLIIFNPPLLLIINPLHMPNISHLTPTLLLRPLFIQTLLHNLLFSSHLCMCIFFLLFQFYLFPIILFHLNSSKLFSNFLPFLIVLYLFLRSFSSPHLIPSSSVNFSIKSSPIMSFPSSFYISIFSFIFTNFPPPPHNPGCTFQKRTFYSFSI